MSIYLNTKTGEFPRHNGDLELLGWQFGSSLPENWVEVVYDPIPTLANGETFEDQPPTLIDGKWRVLRNVRAITVEEIAEQVTNRKQVENRLNF
jgi:hypothetical protein